MTPPEDERLRHSTRAPGRPDGSYTEIVLEAAFAMHDMVYLRWVVLGLPEGEGWTRFMASAGDGTRNISSPRRAAALAQRAIREAERRGCLEDALLALHAVASGADTDAGAPRSQPRSDSRGRQLAPKRPTLDAWIAAKIEQGEVDDASFYTEREWQQLYVEEFGHDHLAVPMPAIALAEEEPCPASPAAPREGSDAVKARLAALDRIESILAQRAQPAHRCDSWLRSTLAAALAAHGIHTLADLCRWLNRTGPRFHVQLRGVGEELGARLWEWASRVSASWDEPVGLPSPARRHATSQPVRASPRPPTQRPAAHPPPASRDHASHTVSASASATHPDPDRPEEGRGAVRIAPLERLEVPPALRGSGGRWRAPGGNQWGARDDIDAVRCWLNSHVGSPSTRRSYHQSAEVYLVWLVAARSRALSDADSVDVQAFCQFLKDPPEHWRVRSPGVRRDDEAWRPLRGPLSPSTIRRILLNLSSMYGAMQRAGYVVANPVAPVLAAPPEAPLRMNTERSLDETQVRVVFEWLDTRPDMPSVRRLRLILELAVTTGMRLGELCSARMGGFARQYVPGMDHHVLRIVGKGGREREIVVSDTVRLLIEQHRRDRVASGTSEDPNQNRVRTTEGFVSAEVAQARIGDLQPLVGALRPAPAVPGGVTGRSRGHEADTGEGRHVTGHASGATLADRFGSLDPGALSRTVRCALRAAALWGLSTGRLDARSAEGLRSASPHWLRHTFGRFAAADGISAETIREMMGHANPTSTAAYLGQRPSAVRTEANNLRTARRRATCNSATSKQGGTAPASG